MGKFKIYLILLILSASVGFSGCVEKSPSQTNAVEIKNFSFQPSSIEISAGTTVTWINRDSAEHTITAKDGSFNSGNIKTGGMFNHTFSNPGTYQYQCLIHPSMVGEVVVTEPMTNASKAGPAEVKSSGSNLSINGFDSLNTSGANASASNAPMVGLKLIAQGFAAPMEFVSSGDGTGRMFAVDQTGIVKIITADEKVIAEPFLNLSDRMVTISPRYDERGLLGLAFHPNFARNGRLFAFYSAPLRSSAPQGWSCTNRLSEFTISSRNPNVVDMNSEKILMEIDKPQMNHNGGTIAFGPDGYLYVPLGDGGNANDVGVGHVAGGNAQDTTTLLGKILRIDVNGKDNETYSIPADNPFITMNSVLPEIWAYGFRNPWRISFDKEGRLFVSDAGQNLWEEVDIVTKGGNYGWNIREGTRCFDPDNPNASPANCSDKGRRSEPLLDPIIEYDHHNRTVVVGGYVYEGSALPELNGSYVFADWSSGFAKGDGVLYLARPSGQGLWKMEEIGIADRPEGRINEYIRSFGQDDKGELYLLTSDEAGPQKETGKIYKLVSSRSNS
ncbi:MAG: hypothetical protein EHM14_09010 [Methanothrix sp.]|nr:MAG: hypothetical protein EHM14_09010 [Methanothrix sp.]